MGLRETHVERKLRYLVSVHGFQDNLADDTIFNKADVGHFVPEANVSELFDRFLSLLESLQLLGDDLKALDPYLSLSLHAG